MTTQGSFEGLVCLVLWWCLWRYPKRMWSRFRPEGNLICQPTRQQMSSLWGWQGCGRCDHGLGRRVFALWGTGSSFHFNNGKGTRWPDMLWCQYISINDPGITPVKQLYQTHTHTHNNRDFLHPQIKCHSGPENSIHHLISSCNPIYFIYQPIYYPIYNQSVMHVNQYKSWKHTYITHFT